MPLLRSFVRSFALAALFAPAATMAQSPDAPPYQSEINRLADRLASDIHSYAQKASISPEVLVIDFVNQSGNMNVFGQRAAEALSDALQTRLAPGELLDRQQFRRWLISSGYAPFDLRDNAVLQSSATRSGANLIITGRIFVFKNSDTLQVQLAALPDGQGFSSASTDISAPSDVKELLDTPLDWPILPYALTHCVARTRDAFAALGVTPPKCVKCGPPDYDEDARLARWEGTVLLNVIVNEQGRVSSITVAQSAPYGIDHQAIKTVSKWRLEPAMQNGKPVQACTQIEVQFRLFK